MPKITKIKKILHFFFLSRSFKQQFHLNFITWKLYYNCGVRKNMEETYNNRTNVLPRARHQQINVFNVSTVGKMGQFGHGLLIEWFKVLSLRDVKIKSTYQKASSSLCGNWNLSNHHLLSSLMSLIAMMKGFLSSWILFRHYKFKPATICWWQA